MSNKSHKVSKTQSSIAQIAAAVGLSLAISACGGSTIRPTTPVIPNSPPATPPTTPVPPPAPPTTPQAPPTSTNPNDYLTAEFLRGDSLEAVGAHYAYAAGITGRGSIIGILDFNFDFTSSELTFLPSSRGINQTYRKIYEAQIGEEGPTDPHGNAVAVFAAGKKNNVDTHGVAYDASIIAVDYFSGVYVQQVLQSGITYHVADPYSYMTDLGVKVINISIGYDEDDIITNPPAVTERYVNASPLNAIANGALLVAAAGNAGHPEPMLSNLEILDEATNSGYLNSNTGAFIMVGSVDQNNVISSFSDRAGRAQNNFMVAPGEQVVFPWTDENGAGLFRGNGTSFAAPLVTGAAALLFQQWPQLSGDAAANILLSTATDLGDPGTDAIYGRGLLNIQAAMSPIGNPVGTIAGSSATLPINSISLILGQSFGDAMPEGLTHFMGLDDYNRDFYFDLSGQVIASTHYQTSLAAALRYDQNWGASRVSFGKTAANIFIQSTGKSQSWLDAQTQYYKDTHQISSTAGLNFTGTIAGMEWSAGYGLSLNQAIKTSLDKYSNIPKQTPISLAIQFEPYLAPGGSFASLSLPIEGETRLTVGVSINQSRGITSHPDPLMREDRPTFTALLQLNKNIDDFEVQTRYSFMQESGTILGSRSSQGIGLSQRATTQFVGVQGAYFAGRDLTIEVSAKTAFTHANIPQKSYINSLNHFISTAWSAKLKGSGLLSRNAGWSLGIFQPLRVENASLSVLQAVAIDYSNGAPLFENKTYSLTPTGREIAIEAAWRYEQAGWMVQSSLLRRQNAAHVADAVDNAAILWFKSRF